MRAWSLLIFYVINGQKLRVTQVGDNRDFVTYNSKILVSFVVLTDKRTINVIIEPKGKLFMYSLIKSYASDDITLVMGVVEEKLVKQADFVHDFRQARIHRTLKTTRDRAPTV